MELAEALKILSALADGRHPLTGQPLGAGDVCLHPQVEQALRLVARQSCPPEAGGQGEVGPLERAGKPWTMEEKEELISEFEAGATISQLARKHGRTRQAIQGRLYLLGKVPHWRSGAWRDGSADRCGGASVTATPPGDPLKEGSL